MRISIYPNGEIRATVGATVPAPRRDAGRTRPTSSVPPRCLIEVKEAQASITCLSFKTCDELPPGYGGQPRERGFSLYARRTIARAGGCFAPASEGRLLFLTGTLPGGTDRAMRALSCWSAWFVHQLVTRIPRIAGCRSADLLWTWVWEFQGRGALHWHCAIELPTPDQAQLVHDGFRSLWIQLIQSLSERAGVDCCERAEGGTWASLPDIWRIDAQFALSSPSNYLAKYLSKGTSTASASATHYYPSRWYGCSRLLVARLRDQTLHLSDPATRSGGEPSTPVLDALSALLAISHPVRSIAHKFFGGVTLVAYLLAGQMPVARSIVDSVTVSVEVDFAMHNLCPSAVLSAYAHIRKFAQYPHLVRRYALDLGPYHNCIFSDYLETGVAATEDRDALIFIDWCCKCWLYLAGIYELPRPVSPDPVLVPDPDPMDDLTCPFNQLDLGL